MKQEKFNYVKRLQARTAMLAVGRSTLRNQGAPGMVAVARKYLCSVNLRRFSVRSGSQFFSVLDRQTEILSQRFPAGGRGNWGAARKCLNIFLRDVCYCRPLCDHFALAAIEKWLEVPLDSNVYKGLSADSERDVPVWPGIKSLSSEVSAELQAAAYIVAESFGFPRVHLDIRYWRKDQIDGLVD